MQNGPSKVTSGAIAPSVLGPAKNNKEVIILSGVVLLLGGLIATAWFYGQQGDQGTITPATDKAENSAVSELFKKSSVLHQADASTTNSTQVTAPVGTLSDIIHTDVYFEAGKKGLTDEGKAQLSTQANFLMQHQDYAVLIQGYTDPQGSAGYNLKLGMKRAETVKEELLKAGVAEQQMKVVSLGEEGVLCIDNSETCRHINRRVHLEIRKIGQEHMATLPAAATSTDPSEAGIDAVTKGEEIDPLMPLSPEPTPGS